jgi:hypothetical protein
MRNILATVALVGLFCLPLRAEITVKEYQKAVHSSDRTKADAMKLYVMGVGAGMAWAETAAEKNNAPLYCQPPNFLMNGNLLHRHPRQDDKGVRVENHGEGAERISGRSYCVDGTSGVLSLQSSEVNKVPFEMPRPW